MCDLSVSTYRMSSANSYVDRLNTEGGSDPASWLMCGDPRICWLSSSKNYAVFRLSLQWARVAA